VTEPLIHGFRGRIAFTVLYGIVCALEFRGLQLALAGQYVLTLPSSWKFTLWGIGLWLCWEVVRCIYKTSYQRTEYVIDGIILLIVTSLIAIVLSISQAFEMLRVFYAETKIVEKTGFLQMTYYAVFALICGFPFFVKTKRIKSQLLNSDRFALLMISFLFLSRISMNFATLHQAIVLKEMTCLAVACGLIAMIVGLFQVERREEPVTTQSQDALLESLLGIDTLEIKKP